MRTLARLLVCAVIACGTTAVAQDIKEPGHEWLAQLAGEWEIDAEMVVDPSQPPIKTKGKETARSLGGLWIISESTMEFQGMKMTAITTFGFDREKKKYVGTFVASMHDFLWKYDGSLDKTGKILTFDAEGPNPLKPGKLFKLRDVYEVKSKDHKILTSSMQTEDGKWQTFATANYRRKK